VLKIFTINVEIFNNEPSGEAGSSVGVLTGFKEPQGVRPKSSFKKVELQHGK